MSAVVIAICSIFCIGVTESYTATTHNYLGFLPRQKLSTVRFYSLIGSHTAKIASYVRRKGFLFEQVTYR